MLINAAILVVTILSMECVAYAAHRFIMHGPGWGWHESHHVPHDELLEKNDLYAVAFAAAAFALLLISPISGPLYWVGIGMSVYGLLYFVVHDGLVHRRWPFSYVPRRGYLKRLVQAHRLHHATEGRDGAVSFGFLYAPPIRRLKAELKRPGTDGDPGAGEPLR